jgi:coenzyme F420-reducing hydrogenase beta subunit
MTENHPEKRAKNEDRNHSLNRDANGILGVYSDMFSAKSGIDGQDGGMVTAMLISGLNSGALDSAIVVQRKKGYNAEAVIAKDIDEVKASKRTVYLKIRTTPKLRDLAEQGKKRIAVVCAPCEARAARKIRQTLKHNFPDADVTVVGLFCFEAFNYDKLKEETNRILGIDIDKAEKTQIHKGKFTVQLAEKEYTCKIGDLNKAVEKGCLFCDDFSARLADISVGSVGSRSGYSTVIVRSDKGKKLLENLEATKARADKDEIIKLSRIKKERAKRSFAAF